MVTNKVSHLNAQEIEQQRAQERTRWGDPARVRFLAHFFDGSLAEQFAAIGQDAHIRIGDIRTLPAALLERCIQSGAKVEVVYD